MKECIRTCSIFFVILITYLFIFGYTLINSSDLKKLDSLLDDEQRVIYAKIKKERLHHFYSGLGVGALLGLLIIFSNTGFKSKYCFPFQYEKSTCFLITNSSTHQFIALRFI